MTENVIVENILSQVYSQVHHYQVVKDIIDHSADGSAFKRSNRFIRSCVGDLHAKKTTRGWKLEVEWKYGTLSWILLNFLNIKQQKTYRVNLPLNGGCSMLFANETELSQSSNQNTGKQHISLGFRFLRRLTRHTKLIGKRGLHFEKIY